MGSRNYAMLAVLVVVVTSVVSLASGSDAAIPRKLSEPGSLIKQLCGKTDYVNICIVSVAGNLKGEASGITILSAEIDACAIGTKAALAQVVILSKAASKESKQALNVCKSNFRSAIDSLTNAKKAITARDVGTLNSELSAVITFMSTCSDAYTEVSSSSPLTKVNEKLMHHNQTVLDSIMDCPSLNELELFMH